MECKKAFDLDGVLAEKPPQSEKKWGRMKGDERKARKNFLLHFYANAKPLLPWDGKSIVVTARKLESYDATLSWFLKYYGKMPQIYFLTGTRSVLNVVNHKAGVLQVCKITHYYEDNKEVLRGIKALYPECQYFFVDESLKIDPF